MKNLAWNWRKGWRMKTTSQRKNLSFTISLITGNTCRRHSDLLSCLHPVCDAIIFLFLFLYLAVRSDFSIPNPSHAWNYHQFPLPNHTQIPSSFFPHHSCLMSTSKSARDNRHKNSHGAVIKMTITRQYLFFRYFRSGIVNDTAAIANMRNKIKQKIHKIEMFCAESLLWRYWEGETRTINQRQINKNKMLLWGCSQIGSEVLKLTAQKNHFFLYFYSLKKGSKQYLTCQAIKTIVTGRNIFCELSWARDCVDENFMTTKKFISLLLNMSSSLWWVHVNDFVSEKNLMHARDVPVN